MDKHFINYVRELSKRDPKNLQGKALKTAEEMGTLAQRVLSYTGAPGNRHRIVQREDLLSDCADLILCSMSIAYDVGVTDDDFEKILWEKSRKWEGLQTSEAAVGQPLYYEVPSDALVWALLYDARTPADGTIVFPNAKRFNQYVKAYVSKSVVTPPSELKLPQGWQCPCCKSVWAPSVTFCGCQSTQVGTPRLVPMYQEPLPTTPAPVVPPNANPWWLTPWTPNNPWYGTWSTAGTSMSVTESGALITSKRPAK